MNERIYCKSKFINSYTSVITLRSFMMIYGDDYFIKVKVVVVSVI